MVKKEIRGSAVSSLVPVPSELSGWTTFRLSLLLAGRNLQRNRRRSALTIGAIAFALVCLIVFQAMKEGLHRQMVDSSVGLDSGSLQIQAKGYESNLAVLLPLPDSDAVLAALPTAAAPRLKTHGLLLAGRQSVAVVVSGVAPERERMVTAIAGELTAGTYLAERGQVLVGRQLAGGLGLSVGETLTLMAQDAFGKPVTRRFVIGGVYGSGFGGFDRTRVFVRLGDLQEFLDAPGEVTEIALKLPEAQNSAMAGQLKGDLAADRYQIRTWQDISPDVHQLIELNNATMNVLIGIVFVIVAMGITNTMTTVVFERFRELGLMAALGTTPAGLVLLVALESFLLGLAASLCGSVLGWLACLYLGRYGVDLTSLTSANQYFANNHVLKGVLLPADLLLANICTLGTSLLAGLYPAFKASRLEPVEALTHV